MLNIALSLPHMRHGRITITSRHSLWLIDPMHGPSRQCTASSLQYLSSTHLDHRVRGHLRIFPRKYISQVREDHGGSWLYSQLMRYCKLLQASRGEWDELKGQTCSPGPEWACWNGFALLASCWTNVRFRAHWCKL